ncbi:MAG: transcriptional regulator GcvA [Reyranellaceae bacterium]
MRSLPPLNALRAFEAAARHLSFTLAAEELHVTQAAVSHQVKALEDRLGLKLFRRLPRGLMLTEQGQALLPELRGAFDRIEQAMNRLSLLGTEGPLTISLMTTFALTWLVPRLHRFQARHPTIEVRMLTTQRLADFAREDVDLAIRYSTDPRQAGLRADKLFNDLLTPLCGVAHRDRLRTPSDLLRVPLIETTGDLDWPVWLQAAGVRQMPRLQAMLFDSTKIAVDAAMEGAGVAIGAPFLFRTELASGRLFQPFDLVVPNGKGFWIVGPESTAEQPKLKAFRDWILEEAKSDLETSQLSLGAL